jgi:HSP20 family protein
MKIVKWDPFSMNHFFDGSHGDRKDKQCNWSPAVDVYETDKEIVLTAEIPGVHKEDIALTVLDNVLTLKGDRRFERDVKQENYFRVERNYGYFCRRFAMPCEVDPEKINAVFSDGVLKVVLPKTESARKVHVKVKH